MKLVFAVHCHQPFGQLDAVLSEAIERAYRPFIDVLRHHPETRVNVHYSGPLLEQLDDHPSGLLDLLLTVGDQIEWMGGAMYEPILPAIPIRDRLDHLTRMKAAISDRFGQEPSSAWIPERVWEPSLIGTLNEAGYSIVPLDDIHFERGGVDHLDRPYIVHHLDRLITAYPIAVDLRYAAPREDPEVLVESLRHLHEHNPDAIAVLADDGEKYGLWTGSHERVYGTDGWLDRFFTAAENADWVELTTFEAHAADSPPTERASLPPGSYQEMTDWSDGRWEHFLDRYPESDVLYRKMLAASNRAARPKTPDDATTELLRGQGNDAYWHGAFGGLYLPHLRSETHRRLLSSRLAIDKAGRSGRSWVKVNRYDWDADGRDELCVELPDQSWVLDMDDGALHYYDDKPSQWMVPDVVAAHVEDYHADGTPVRSHRWLATRTLPIESASGALEQTSDMLDPGVFELAEVDSGKGSVTVSSSSHHGLIERTVTAESRSFEVSYTIEGVLDCRFGPEVPVAVWRGVGRLRVDGGAWQDVDMPMELSGHRFRFRHEGRGNEILISLRQPGALFVLPLTTASRNESGQEEIQQGVLFWPHWVRPANGTYRLSVEVLDVADQEESEAEGPDSA